MDDPVKGAVWTIAISGFICGFPGLGRRACPCHSQLCSAAFQFTVVAIDFSKNKQKKKSVMYDDVIDSK